MADLGAILVAVGCEMPHLCPLSDWNVPMAKKPQYRKDMSPQRDAITDFC